MTAATPTAPQPCPSTQSTQQAAPATQPSNTDAACATTTMLHSADLLQGHPSVAIEHHGVLYRLHTTKLGKLILTK